MSAPSLKEILKVESQIQDAWRQILQNAGVTPTQLFIQFLAASSVTPRIEINLVRANATGHYSEVLPGTFMNSAWEGELVSRIVTRRNVNGDQHDELLAICRREAAYFLDSFNANVLPWHAMSQMKENGTHRLIDADRDEDITELTHKVVFSVRKNAWPASEP